MRLYTTKGRGIGLAIVKKFLQEGAELAFFARGQEGVDAARRALGEIGVCYGAAMDAQDHNAAYNWVEQAAGQLGGIDIVVDGGFTKRVGF